VDGFTLSLWILRLAFVGLLYLFLYFVVRALWRDLRTAAASSGRPLGRLVVLASPEGRPSVGRAFPLEAVNSMGRDVNNTIVIDDRFASSEHALLTFRGRTWYLEDRGSTNGTWLNGEAIAGASPLGYGDEVQVGQVRFRLDRASSE
jgi:pSer/pThr/pTyr-binding forkhead associated (FHA) protein